MATTTGLVQVLKVIPGSSSQYGYAYIGPSPGNTSLLYVRLRPGISATETAIRSAMIDALSNAMVTRREVTVSHGDSDAEITAVVASGS